MDLGLFQRDVARMIGVSTDTITNWEKGRTKPGSGNLTRIVQFLDMNGPNHQDVIDNKQAIRSRGYQLDFS